MSVTKIHDRKIYFFHKYKIKTEMDSNDSSSLEYIRCYLVEFDYATTRMYVTCIRTNDMKRPLFFKAILSFQYH